MDKHLKVRVWEPVNKTMHYLNMALYEMENTIARFVLPAGHQCCNRKSYTYMNLDAVIVMQNTGLIDRAECNREIYKGDVITATTVGEKPIEVTGHIEYKKGMFGLIPDTKKDDTFIPLYHFLLNDTLVNGVVVGNIYEPRFPDEITKIVNNLKQMDEILANVPES